MKNDFTTTSLFRKKDIEKALAAIEAEKSLAQDQVITKPLQALSVQKIILFALVCASFVNTFILGVVDIIAVSGFIGDTGIDKLPWLWVGELILSLFISSVVIQIIDKHPRIKMMKTLIIILAFTYFLLALLFFLGISTKILYPVMYLIYAQQSILFPMVFWNVANQVYTLAEAKKTFPLLSSGELLGRLFGYSLFTLTGLLGHAEISQGIIQNPTILMAISGLFYAIGYIVFSRMPKPKTRPINSEESAFIENLKRGIKTIQEVPFFRNMALLVSLTWITITILLYNFYASLNHASEQGLQFQTVYSIYNIAVLLIPLLFQWTIGDTLLEKTSAKTGYLFLPFTLLISIVIAFFFSSLLGGISALFIVMIVYRGWYMPLYQSLYALVPQERRGRIRGLLGSYSYIFGSFIGAIVTGGIIFLIPYLDIKPAYARNLYLLIALLASVGAIYIAFRIRATYDDSLLSWRIAQRKRTSSVLDRLD